MKQSGMKRITENLIASKKAMNASAANGFISMAMKNDS